MQGLEQVLDNQPDEAQEGPANLVHMARDQLDLESNLSKGIPVHAADQLPPHQEEEEEEDSEEEPFSSHKGEEEDEGAPREGHQEKKRKRDEKFDRRHPMIDCSRDADQASAKLDEEGSASTKDTQLQSGSNR